MHRRVRASKVASTRPACENIKTNTKIKLMPLEINKSETNTENENKFNGYKANYLI